MHRESIVKVKKSMLSFQKNTHFEAIRTPKKWFRQIVCLYVRGRRVDARLL